MINIVWSRRCSLVAGTFLLATLVLGWKFVFSDLQGRTGSAGEFLQQLAEQEPLDSAFQGTGNAGQAVQQLPEEQPLGSPKDEPWEPSCHFKLYLTSYMLPSPWQFMNAWSRLLDDSVPIELTADRELSDVVFVMNAPSPQDVAFVGSNKNKTIWAHMEPDNPPLADADAYLEAWTHDRALNTVEWLLPGRNYAFVAADVPPEAKLQRGNAVAAVISAKINEPGHIARVRFLQYLEQHHADDIELHIYGQTNAHGFKSYKGKLPSDSKAEAVRPYKYHFNSENNFKPNYITEKFYDSVLGESFTFYAGAPNIAAYYPQAADRPPAYLHLDIDANEKYEAAAQRMVEAIAADAWQKGLEEIRDLKDYILTRWSLAPRVLEVLKQARVTPKCQLAH